MEQTREFQFESCSFYHVTKSMMNALKCDMCYHYIQTDVGIVKQKIVQNQNVLLLNSNKSWSCEAEN